MNICVNQLLSCPDLQWDLGALVTTLCNISWFIGSGMDTGSYFLSNQTAKLVIIASEGFTQLQNSWNDPMWTFSLCCRTLFLKLFIPFLFQVTGVFSKEYIPQGTRFGPLQGEIYTKDNVPKQANRKYFWRVRECILIWRIKLSVKRKHVK